MLFLKDQGANKGRKIEQKYKNTTNHTEKVQLKKDVWIIKQNKNSG